MLEAATSAHRYPVLAGNKHQQLCLCVLTAAARCLVRTPVLCTSYESKPIKYQVIIISNSGFVAFMLYDISGVFR